MKEQLLTKKILDWYDLNKRSLPWRKKVSFQKRQYYTLVSEFMLQQTQVVTVVPYFNKFINKIPDFKSLARINDRRLIKIWEGLGYYSRAKNLKKTAQIILKKFNGKLPNNFEDLVSLPGIGNYTASAILAIVFNKPYIPLDGNIERVLKRYLYLKKEKEIEKINIIKKKKIFGISLRSSDYAQALMELGALVCKPINPNCNQCPIKINCISLKKNDFNLAKSIKKNRNKFFLLKVYKKKQSYLLIKNTKFNFLKNLIIFPMEEIPRPKKFNENLNFKMSNMNMNIKIEYIKKNKKLPSSYWIDKKRLNNHMLPTFTKKVVKYLERNK
ncbi:A/G-specific adenine glycosylase [Candidatus Pelagibacter communis]|uniref:A/G-specific adenine glycosylase n=1 Tax=Pelagibacter ubique TaxID=198252 RepID=UPI00094D2F79|nr:A/G-specific adenine glycosylase [Candidatus Pelagibacter ubique]|tara:strand:- start:95 stop:1078 length:984 start_codon:yes stop_codon:yes gene_type:complete